METESVMEIDDLAGLPEWQLACRIAASKGLGKSDRLSKFLLYICERQLLGLSHEITEQRIGIQIFRRPTDYNPSEDNIVRSYARLLRKRLDTYFEGEGAREAMRIVIPRGGYVPIFQSSPAIHEPEPAGLPDGWDFAGDPHALDSAAADSPTAENSRRWSEVAARDFRSAKRLSNPAWLSGWVGFVLGILLASAGWLGFRAVQRHSAEGPAHVVWKQLFQPDRNTLIVPSDSGLGILQNLSRHLVSVEQYANGSYVSEMPLPAGVDARNFNDLARERYTSVVSLNIASQLTRLPEFIPDRAQIRYARSITAEDIENSNVILLGSKHTNPWVSLFEKRLAFRLEYTPEVDASYVLNEHPAGAEQKMYRNSTDANSNVTYGTIAYLPSLDGPSHVLIVQGLNMAATQAAADLLFNGQAIQAVLKQATQRDGSLRPFELLIETTSIGATAPGAQIVATRIY